LLTRNSCLITNPFACEQDSQTIALPIIHPYYSAGFLLKKTDRKQHFYQWQKYQKYFYLISGSFEGLGSIECALTIKAKHKTFRKNEQKKKEDFRATIAVQGRSGR
jgi:hypothetical protein